MKKLIFNGTLSHKQSEYRPMTIEVEKVVELRGKEFKNLMEHTLRDNPHVKECRDLMYISGKTAHCVLFLDADSKDGIIVEAEGSDYARKSQFIPNARELIEYNEFTPMEKQLHGILKGMADKIAELAHSGYKSFFFEEMLDDTDIKSVMLSAVGQLIEQRGDMQSVRIHDLDIAGQPEFTVEPKQTNKLKFYSPIVVEREADYETDWDSSGDLEQLSESEKLRCCTKDGNYTVKKAEFKDYEIIAKAYDEENNEGTATATVKVNEAKAPEINVIFDKDIYVEGDALVGFVKAEGSRDIASLTAKVNGQLLAVDDGRFEIAELKEGIYKFEFSAEDISGLSSKTEKSVTVLSKDNADTRLVALIDKQVKLGDNAELKIIASDEVDKSTISATLNGKKITLDSNLRYQFKGEKLFDNVFEITAKTLSGESLSITLTVLVYETNKPKIGLVFTSHEDGYHYAHDDITGTLTVTDESGIREVHVYYDGEELPIDENNHVYINDFVVANHTVIVKAVDNFGNVAVSGMVFYTVTITDGTASGSSSEDLDSNELNAFIYSPQDGGSVKGLDYIIGRADGTKFSSYKLEYASVDDKKFILLKEGKKSVNNQILSEFDTTMLRNGTYFLRLTVFDAEGNYKIAGVYVAVEGNAKIGNFSIGFEDLTTNSLQTPLTLTRMYDSRDRNISGDFGYGWSQAVKNVRIYTNGPLGYGWNREYDWKKGVTFNPTRSHIITVDWGNGKTDKFTMTARPRNDAGMGYTAGIYFSPTNGTTSSLSAEETPGYYMCTQGYLVDDEEYTVFDPENWTLTTADGTKYAIIANAKIKKTLTQRE